MGWVLDGGEPGNSDKGAFDICVAHLGGYLFFDATSQKVRPAGSTGVFNEEEDFWIPLQVFGTLEAKDDRLDLLLLDDSWLQDHLKSGRLRLTCSQDDEGYYLLTAPSKELKQFAIRFAADPNAFSFSEDFYRTPGKEASTRYPSAIPKAAVYRTTQTIPATNSRADQIVFFESNMPGTGNRKSGG